MNEPFVTDPVTNQKIEVLRHLLSTLRPDPVHLQYLDLRLQDFSIKEITEKMNNTADDIDLLQQKTVYWFKKIEFNENGFLKPFKFNKQMQPKTKEVVQRGQCTAGNIKAIALPAVHCKIFLKDELHSRRLELFLISQSIQCTPLKLLDGLMTAEILITDNLELAARSRSPIVLLANCFEGLPNIKSLIGCVSIPFSFSTIAASLSAIIKRVEPQIKDRDLVIQLGDLDLNQRCIQAVYQGSLIHLTAMQFRIVERLVQSQGDFVSYDDIAIAGWGDAQNRLKNIGVLIYQIRQKGIPIQLGYGYGYAIAT